MDLIDFGLNLGYVLLGLGALSILGASLYHLATNFKDYLWQIVGLTVILVIFLIGYGIAAGNMIEYREVVVKGSLSKLVGAGIITGWVFIIVAFLGLIVTEVKSIFR